jgi:nucleotide-binding universal stress UspA family protein
MADHVIAVGYDGSPPARRALRWALDEATTRHLPVHLVHAVVPPVPTSALGYAVPVDLDLIEQLREGAGRVLVTAAEEAALTHPGVTVSPQVAIGNPSAVLVDVSQEAVLVVVGSRGRGGFRGLLLGSVGIQVASHSRCPVVILREEPPAGGRQVVVGVDGSPLSRAALSFGFDHASRHGLRLLAVHAWEPPTYELLAAPVGPPPVSLRDITDDEIRLTTEAISGFGEQYPDVEVEELIVEGSPSRVLLDAQDGCALLVVGSRGRGELLGAMLGSASQAVAHRARVPVAVVHR